MQTRDQKIAEEEARFDEITIGFNALLSELNLTREQLRAFMQDPAQFNEADQRQITSLRSSLDERLANRLAEAPKTSPDSARKSLAAIQPSWIFVR